MGQSRQRFAEEELSRRGTWREMGLVVVGWAACSVKKWWIARYRSEAALRGPRVAERGRYRRGRGRGRILRQCNGGGSFRVFETYQCHSSTALQRPKNF